MHTYEVMSTMVAGRRAELEAAATTSRMATRRSIRSWFGQRSTTAETVRSDTTLVARTVPVAGTAEFHEWASSVGIQLARAGTPSVEGHLRSLARRARELHVAAVSASVLADREAPEVARARAFSRVVVALGTLTPSTSAALDATA
jgi:hypothetical protein